MLHLVVPTNDGVDAVLPSLYRRGSGCRVQGSGFKVQGLGFRVQGLGLRV